MSWHCFVSVLVLLSFCLFGLWGMRDQVALCERIQTTLLNQVTSTHFQSRKSLFKKEEEKGKIQSLYVLLTCRVFFGLINYLLCCWLPNYIFNWYLDNTHTHTLPSLKKTNSPLYAATSPRFWNLTISTKTKHTVHSLWKTPKSLSPINHMCLITNTLSFRIETRSHIQDKVSGQPKVSSAVEWNQPSSTDALCRTWQLPWSGVMFQPYFEKELHEGTWRK